MSDIELFNKFKQTEGSPFPVNDGKQWVFRFSNGYGASVINHSGAYSDNMSGELAVVKWNGEGDNDFDLVYDTPVAGDVLGWLTVSEIAEVLEQIEALPPTVESLIELIDSGSGLWE